MAEKTSIGFDTKERRLQRMEDYSGTALSENAYNAVIGVTLTLGLALTAVLANIGAPLVLNLNMWVVLIGYLVIAIGSGVIMNKTTNPAVSIACFAALSVATGLLLSLVMLAYDLEVIQPAVLITGGVTALMLILGTVFPAFFKKLGPVLFAALLADVVVGLVAGLIFHTYLPILAWVGVAIFSLYIGYDWARAQEYPKTVSNAINSAADIYLDVINIFIRVLEILGSSRK